MNISHIPNKRVHIAQTIYHIVCLAPAGRLSLPRNCGSYWYCVQADADVWLWKALRGAACLFVWGSCHQWIIYSTSVTCGRTFNRRNSKHIMQWDTSVYSIGMLWGRINEINWAEYVPECVTQNGRRYDVSRNDGSIFLRNSFKLNEGLSFNGMTWTLGSWSLLRLKIRPVHQIMPWENASAIYT